MKRIESFLQRLNQLQQSSRFIGFCLAVLKKYGDDTGGYYAALLTYYGFLSLFPLLLVLLTLLHLWFQNNPELHQAVATNISSYFPLLGTQLQTNITSIGGVGLGLVVGIALAVYGARGGAEALRFALDNLWRTPKKERTGFPKNILKDLGIIGISGLGFIATIGISVLVSSLDGGVMARILLALFGTSILAISIACVLTFGSSQPRPLRSVMRGSAIAATVIQPLLVSGSMLLGRQLDNLGPLYGTFAITLGLLFWIYLFAQVLVYAIEIDVVRELRLWPRSLDDSQPTAADRRLGHLQTGAEAPDHKPRSSRKPLSNRGNET